MYKYDLNNNYYKVIGDNKLKKITKKEYLEKTGDKLENINKLKKSVYPSQYRNYIMLKFPSYFPVRIHGKYIKGKYREVARKVIALDRAQKCLSPLFKSPIRLHFKNKGHGFDYSYGLGHCMQEISENVSPEMLSRIIAIKVFRQNLLSFRLYFQVKRNLDLSDLFRSKYFLILLKIFRNN